MGDPENVRSAIIVVLATAFCYVVNVLVFCNTMILCVRYDLLGRRER